MVDNKQSIQEYLQLYHRAWFVEFDLSDFGASLSSLLELPSSIYHSQTKAFFWEFMNQFLQKSSINFILNKDPSHADPQESKIDLALTGYWENKEYAIPLWIMNDILIGFEIISSDRYHIIDSLSLKWNSPYLPSSGFIKNTSDTDKIYVINSNLFTGNSLYLKISHGVVFISDFSQEDEVNFFKRIASTVIPEIDELNPEEELDEFNK